MQSSKLECDACVVIVVVIVAVVAAAAAAAAAVFWVDYDSTTNQHQLATNVS